MTKERSLLSSIVSKLMLILAIAGLLVVAMPERLHADDEVTTSAAKVEETNTGLKAKLSVSATESKSAVSSQSSGGGKSLSRTAGAGGAIPRDRYGNRPLVISDEFGGRSGNPTPAPTSREDNFRTDSTGATPGEGNFQTLPSGRVLVKSDEFNFRTLPGQSVVVSPESSFTTTTGSTSDTGEHSFTTLSEGGGGCTENCGGGGCTENCGGGGGGGGSSSGGGGHRRQEPPASCPLYLREFIKLGRENDRLEVLKLQLFLRTFEKLEVPVSGVYDQVTYEAVKVFQSRYSQDVLGPWGISAPTGYVFITTRLAINNIYCDRTTANDLDLRNFYPEFAAGLARYGIDLDEGVSEEAEDNLDFPEDIMGSPVEVVATTTIVKTDFFQAAALGLLEWFSDSGHILNTILVLAIIALAIWLFKLKKENERWKRSQQTPANLPVGGESATPALPEEEGVLKNLDREDDWDNWLDEDNQPTLDKLD